MLAWLHDANESSRHGITDMPVFDSIQWPERTKPERSELDHPGVNAMR
jgi:hypothetical protein